MTVDGSRAFLTSLEAAVRHLLHLIVPILKSPPVMFLFLALAVMGPLLQPGRILALDSPLALNWDISGFFWGTSNGHESVFAATHNSAPIASVLESLKSVLPFWVVEKLWLILLFWLCGVSAFRLPYLQGVGRYYAGMLYAVNPFTYIRFVSGQWGILGAYALTPLAVTAFVDGLENPHPRHAVKVALWLTLIGLLQIHGLVLVCLVLAVLYLVRSIVLPGSFIRSLPTIFLGIAIFLGINTFWIMRYVGSGGGILHNMSVEELDYFAAAPFVDVVSLRGFWLSDTYLDIADLVPLWWLLFLPLLFLGVYGLLSMFASRRLRWLALGLALLALVSITLAIGPGIPSVATPYLWLWEHFPWYRAFRDSHKFVGPLVLVYAYLGAFGLQSLCNIALWRPVRIKKLAYIGTGVFLAVIPVYTFPIFGTWGQLQPTGFPLDWQEVRSVLDDDREDYNILVLPWHMYMNFSWLPNKWDRMANPAPNFFSQPTISGDNIEANGNFSDSGNRQSKYIESLLDHIDSVQDFGNLIAPLNAKYVVLFKEGDYNFYKFLYTQRDLQLAYDGDTIALFRNLKPTSQAYTVSDSIQISNFKELIELAAQHDTLELLYALQSIPSVRTTPQASSEGKGNLGDSTLQETSPISYRLWTDYDAGYVVFVLPQRTAKDGWRYNGEPASLKTLGMMPAFPVHPGNNTISFTRFYERYLPTYLLAVLSLFGAAFVYWRWK